MELKGHKNKTCEVKTGVLYIYVKSKDQSPEASDHTAEPSVIKYINTCMYYENKYPMR